MKQIVDQSVAEPRFNMLLLLSFAGFAVLLAVVGIYGVMSYTAAQRTHEIGVRIALGALHRDIVRLLLKEGMALALAGLAIGLGGAFAVTRILSSLLYEIDARDPFTFATVSLLLIFVAALACFVPAFQASQVNPMEVIRSE
jgi:putative ABC transport system permease protein